MAEKYLEPFGEPAIKAGSLSVWVHEYAYPHAADGWDGNWLMVTARCIGIGTSVIVKGVILDTVSFYRFSRELEAMHQSLEGSATLDSDEPNLVVKFTATGKTGQIDIETEITPDHMHEAHQFFDTVDQSYLPLLQAGCKRVLRQFPIRDPESRGIQIER